MSTEDEREKRREGSPEWHRRGQIAYGSTASRRWPRSMSRSRERLSSGGNSSGRNSAILKREIAHLERIIARGQKCLGVSKGRSGRRLRQRNGHDLLPCFWTDHCWKIPV